MLIYIPIKLIFSEKKYKLIGDGCGRCLVETRRKTGKQKAVIFPGQQLALDSLGQNLLLARKRRNMSQKMLSERTGLNRKTIYRIEKGDPGVSLGHYARVLGALSLIDELAKVGLNDELGRKLQDIESLGGRHR
jgi:DNA-binding XRE family transcriptional regulator